MAPVPLLDRSLRTRPSGGTIACALVVAVSLVLAGCSGGSKHNAQSTQSTKRTKATVRPKTATFKTVVLKVGSVNVESAGPSGVQIAKSTGKAILGATQKYIDTAMFAPLERGRVGSGYSALFDSKVKSAATGSDEPALTDLAAGKVTGLFAKATPVTVSALAGTLGEFLYIATDFDLAVHATTRAGRLTITHHVELTFTKAGRAWVISAYRVQ